MADGPGIAALPRSGGGRASRACWIAVLFMALPIASLGGAKSGSAQQLKQLWPASIGAAWPAGSLGDGLVPAADGLPLSLSVTRAANPWARPLMPFLPSSSSTGPGTAELASDQTPSVSESGVPSRRTISWKLLLPNLLQDQKNVWLFPAHVAKGRHWKPAVAFVTATVGLVTLDPLDAPYFRSTSSYHTFNDVFSTRNTGIGMAAVPATFYAIALVRHDAYDQQTTLFAAEAVLDSTLLETVMKASFRRLRPREVAPGANFWDTFTDARGGLFSGQPGFPSGHAITAFSIATVFADRYSRHRWAPWVAYGLATAVAFSRVTLQAHFVSDVFTGAVLGYSISHYVVLRR